MDGRETRRGQAVGTGKDGSSDSSLLGAEPQTAVPSAPIESESSETCDPSTECSSLQPQDMPPDVLRNMAEIVHHMQTRHYQKANDAYLRLSIGTAAWPIGVTSVGIHERSSQDKLYVDKVAHVLNDEVSRKWIQAVKR